MTLVELHAVQSVGRSFSVCFQMVNAVRLQLSSEVKTNLGHCEKLSLIGDDAVALTVAILIS